MRVLACQCRQWPQIDIGLADTVVALASVCTVPSCGTQIARMGGICAAAVARE